MNKEVTIPRGQGSTWHFYLCRFDQWTLLINAVFISPTRAGSAARPHMPQDYTVHGPREPTILWDPGFFMNKTTGTQLSQHIVIFLSVKFPYSTMKEPSIPNYHFIFLKGPISGWAVSAKYLALSCFIRFPARARRALCRENNPLILKMKREAQQFRVSSKVTESSVAESCTWAPGSCSAVSSYTNPGSDTCKNTTETSANSLYL